MKWQSGKVAEWQSRGLVGPLMALKVGPYEQFTTDDTTLDRKPGHPRELHG
jgi:hypothetical protein